MTTYEAVRDASVPKALAVRVTNQVPGDWDNTCAYIGATGWRSPPGVIYRDDNGCTLSGPAELVWPAYLELARMVADGGHGDDISDDDSEGLGRPALLVESIDGEDMLARVYDSREYDTLSSFVAARRS